MIPLQICLCLLRKMPLESYAEAGADADDSVINGKRKWQDTWIHAGTGSSLFNTILYFMSPICLLGLAHLLLRSTIFISSFSCRYCVSTFPLWSWYTVRTRYVQILDLTKGRARPRPPRPARLWFTCMSITIKQATSFLNSCR